MNRQEETDTEIAGKKKWSSKSLAPAFFHSIFYAAIKLTGRQSAYFMLFFVVSFYCLIPSVRKRASYYIYRRFGKCGIFSGFIHTFRLYWEFGKTLVDRSVLRILGKFNAFGTDVDKKKLRTLYCEHEKLILLTGHAGCWQMGISYLDFLSAPKAVVMLMEKGNVDRHSFKWKTPGEDGAQEITVINPMAPMGGTLEILDALKSKSILCTTADRTLGSLKHTVEVDFLGGKIRVPISSYKIAATTGTPIAIVFSNRTKGGEGCFRVTRVMHIPKETGKGAVRGAQAFAPYAQSFADELAKYCQDHPYQFYNFYNMWQ